MATYHNRLPVKFILVLVLGAITSNPLPLNPMPRQTIYGYLTGVHKDANGNYIMTVRTESGEFRDYPHDGVNTPLTANVKRKKQ